MTFEVEVPREGFSNPYSICGFVGCVVFALSLLPQLWKTYSTKSAKDLSFNWQAYYLLGMTCTMTYFVAYRLLPILVPSAFEFLFTAILTGMKIYYDYIYRAPQPNLKDVDVERNKDNSNTTTQSEMKDVDLEGNKDNSITPAP